MYDAVVAPLVGAWIETFVRCACLFSAASHPSWVRGLKLEADVSGRSERMSHPSWVRGLKHWLLIDCLSPHCRTPRGCVD